MKNVLSKKTEKMKEFAYLHRSFLIRCASALFLFIYWILRKYNVIALDDEIIRENWTWAIIMAVSLLATGSYLFDWSPDDEFEDEVNVKSKGGHFHGRKNNAA